MTRKPTLPIARGARSSRPAWAYYRQLSRRDRHWLRHRWSRVCRGKPTDSTRGEATPTERPPASSEALPEALQSPYSLRQPSTCSAILTSKTNRFWLR